MKLYLVCLLVALSYASAAPEQKQGGGKSMENLFYRMLKAGKLLINSLDVAYKGIEHDKGQGEPIEKLFHEMLKISKKMGKTFDGLAKDFEKRAGPEEDENLDGKNPFVNE